MLLKSFSAAHNNKCQNNLFLSMRPIFTTIYYFWNLFQVHCFCHKDFPYSFLHLVQSLDYILTGRYNTGLLYVIYSSWPLLRKNPVECFISGQVYEQLFNTNLLLVLIAENIFSPFTIKRLVNFITNFLQRIPGFFYNTTSSLLWSSQRVFFVFL